LARAAGAHVVGVVGSSHKVEAARESGAAEVIDKSREDPFHAARRASPRGYDIVLDANGARSRELEPGRDDPFRDYRAS
jgi:NADPH:quinone reductase-like Zn-dependent oxidoreductase